MPGVHDFSAKPLAGEEVLLQHFEGKLPPVVKHRGGWCAFTPQDRALDALHPRIRATRLCAARLSLRPVLRGETIAKVDVNGGRVAAR